MDRGGGGGGVARGVAFGSGMEGLVLVFAMDASVCTREVSMGVVRGGVDDNVELPREGEAEVREETSCDGVRVGKLCSLGGVLGEGVRETDGGTLCPRRGFPERD